ncbi:MAG TPA: hypothetical protein ENF34_02110 [Candidatus Bathyarchaeota archaeon]|nr:hypothetical protein [Candidatus Bathyarchaeota archaeon]
MSTFRKIKRALRDFVFGATTYEMAKTFADMIMYNTYAIMTSALGDMLGYPTSCFYKLRLLPLVLTRINTWKKFMLRERDITERAR